MKKYLLIFACILLPSLAFSQDANTLDSFRNQYFEIIGEDGLSSNLTSATCPVDKSLRTLSFTEFLCLLYNNPLTFYGIENPGSELQKKMLRESPEFKQKNADFVALRNKTLAKPFMVVKPLQGGSHYNIEKKKFECEFKTISDYNKETGAFNLGCVSLYDPSIKVLYYVDRYVRTANLYQHVFIDVPSEEAALDIEQNLSDCALCAVFKYQKTNAIDVLIYKHYQIQGKPVRCCIVNTKYGFVYDANWKASKSKAINDYLYILQQKDEAERLERIRKEEERVAALKTEEQAILDEINSGKVFRLEDLDKNPDLSISDELTDRLNNFTGFPSSLKYHAIITAEGGLTLMWPASFSAAETQLWEQVQSCINVSDPGKIKLPYSESLIPVPLKTLITLKFEHKLISGGFEVKVKYNKKDGMWQVKNSNDIIAQLDRSIFRESLDDGLEMIQIYFTNHPEFDVLDRKPVVCNCGFYSNSYSIEIEGLRYRTDDLYDSVDVESIIKPEVGGR